MLCCSTLQSYRKFAALRHGLLRKQIDICLRSRLQPKFKDGKTLFKRIVVTEKIYQYVLYTVLTVTAAFSIFLVAADNIAPFTTQASMHRNIVTIAPEASGVINHVAVENGQWVNAGDTLFTLDDQSYQLKVKQAKAELIQAEQSFQASEQQLIAAQVRCR